MSTKREVAGHGKHCHAALRRVRPQRRSVVGILAGLLLAPAPASAADWSFEPEAGIAFPYSNDVRIPSTGGTDFSLTETLNAKKEFAWRVRLGTRLAGKHVFAVLVAPLRLESDGWPSHPIVFQGVTYVPSEFVTATYRFDSYRLTYRYQVHESTRLRAGFGVTLKLRDAAIRLQSGATVSEEANTGLVPLLHFKVEVAVTRHTSLLLEGDALAASQGRAEDVLAALELHVAPQFGVRLGYRILEGGADTDDVYNFALVQYAVLGLRVGF